MACPLPAREATDGRPGDAETEPRLGIVLVGNPNVGKSALFGALTGTYVTVSNYPGTTVEITTGAAVVAGRSLPVVDTPGTASFLPSSEDERVTRDILLRGRPHAVVVVGDAKNLDRGLLLAVQLAEMEVPHVLCLNMMDEAVTRGIGVDVGALGDRLGVAVVPTVAVRREGIRALLASLDSPGRGRTRIDYPAPIERALASVTPLLPEAPIAPRGLALMVLAGDETLTSWLRAHVGPGALAAIEDAEERLRRDISEPLALAVARARRRAVARLAYGLTHRSSPTGSSRRWLARLEPLTTHSVWGLPILAIVLLLAYLFVGVLGARTLVDLLEQGLFGRWISPAATSMAARFVPWAPVRDLLVGPYGLITMALAYSLALVLPIVGTFFVAFGALEDSGYLPRLAEIGRAHV